ncbi:MAG: ParB N-terminal domain-containing protein [Alphaproteobacteria bacterium]|nr:ParB N-terminal domain-containing protein [Alphaproteobacteria bacterium]
MSDLSSDRAPPARPFAGRGRRIRGCDGFTNPVLIDAERQIIAGHGRVAAATLLGIEAVPCLRLDHLSEAEKRAYILADNKLALNAGWDREVLAIELQHRVEGQFDVTLTGFSVCEVDIVLAEAASADPNGGDHPDDLIPEAEDPANAVTISGDIWRLGRHLLICGDARDPSTFAALMGGDRADMIFTDPPYNVPIDGHVCGSGKIHHREFAMGTGEMSSAVFTSASVMRRSRPDGCSIRPPAYARYFLLSPAGSPVVGR